MSRQQQTTHSPGTQSPVNPMPASPHPPYRIVASLSSRLEAVEGSLKQFKHASALTGLCETGQGGTPVRRRRESTSRRSNGGQRWSKESASGSPTVLPSLAESHKDGNGMDVTWQMPFTLKCIGTFR